MNFSAQGGPTRDSIFRGLRLGLETWSLGLMVLGRVALSAEAPPVDRALPTGWSQTGDRLVTVCHFDDFAAAVAFVHRLVEPSDRLGHHPDVAIAYNQLTLHLTTHDAGGVTHLDFELAHEIAAIANGPCQPPSPLSAP